MEIIELKSEYIEYVSSIIMDRWKVDKEYAMTEIERWMSKKDNSICFIGIIDNKPMAIGVFDVKSDIDTTINAWNKQLYVEPQYRGKEYGMLMTRKRFEHAKKLGEDIVYLSTVSARDYHLRFGWEIVRYFDKDGERNTIMKYYL